MDGSVDFYRSWADYKRGFGNLNGEFWLGLDKIHRLTKTKSRLRVDLEDTAGKTAYAEYDMFAVTSERAKYQLSLGTYSGNSLRCFSFFVQGICPTEVWKGWGGGTGVLIEVPFLVVSRPFHDRHCLKILCCFLRFFSP